MTTTNRLATETSPYLRQHADNPVDWYPWSEEALSAAREGDRPILLSVGYSACHWCHVMAHECFEDPEVAAAMNAGFVNIKVDREERPDVDSIYMEAVQAIAGGGGWPMTVFLLPDGRPFFGGTYFPKPQFLDLLGRVRAAWEDRRDALERDAAQLAQAIERGARLPLVGQPAPEGPDVVDRAVADLLERHDREWGGFGGAPKFPQATMLDLLLQAWAGAGTPEDELGGAITTTLDAMASGGIYDHLGGGFARYATDRRWLVPHFEKMLYDNALLARTYLHAWQLTGRDAYRQVVEETLGYLLSPPMRQAQGGFSSAEDADSEGEEGRFYVWDAAEVAEVGGPAALEWYGVEPGGNWEGRNILWRPVRGDLLRPPEVEEARAALLARREHRVRPGLDDKVLTEWNAMAVTALAEAGAAMGRDDWVVAAEEAASFLILHLRRPDGRWLRTWSPAGEATGVLAYAGDHAWLIEAFSRLAEATGRAGWRLEAIRAADALLDLFWQTEGGGFATTGSDAPSLITRPMETYDGATPSANSTATRALLRLAALTGDTRYREAADAVLDRMGAALAKAPTAFTGLVAAADLRRAGITEVVITGYRPDLLGVLRGAYRPSVVLAWGEPDPTPLWEGRTEEGAAGLAYVCRNFACAAPTGDPAVLAAQLAGTAG